MKVIRLVSLLVVVLAVSITFFELSTLQAQNFDKKWQLYGHVGKGETSDDEGAFGGGFYFGGGVGIWLSHKWQLDLGMALHSNERLKGPGQFFAEGESLVMGGRLLYHFSRSRVQPFVGLGVSYARHSGASGFLPGESGYPEIPSSPGSRREGTQHFVGPEFAAGMRVFVAESLSIRPEFRLYIGGGNEYEPATDVLEPGLYLTSLSIGVGYHW